MGWWADCLPKQAYLFGKQLLTTHTVYCLGGLVSMGTLLLILIFFGTEARNNLGKILSNHIGKYYQELHLRLGNVLQLQLVQLVKMKF